MSLTGNKRLDEANILSEAQIPRDEPSCSMTAITYYRPWSSRRNLPKGTKREMPREPHNGESATVGDEGTIFFTYHQQESTRGRKKGGKAAGADNISYVLPKMMPRKGKPFLLNIFNSSSRLNYFPTIWNHVVVPLLKPKKKGDETEQYRPISLLSHMSKI